MPMNRDTPQHINVRTSPRITEMTSKRLIQSSGNESVLSLNGLVVTASGSFNKRGGFYFAFLRK